MPQGINEKLLKFSQSRLLEFKTPCLSLVNLNLLKILPQNYNTFQNKQHAFLGQDNLPILHFARLRFITVSVIQRFCFRLLFQEQPQVSTFILLKSVFKRFESLSKCSKERGDIFKGVQHIENFKGSFFFLDNS